MGWDSPDQPEPDERFCNPKLIVHRDFEGEHEMSESCWCQPVAVDDCDDRDGDEIAMTITEKLDG